MEKDNKVFKDLGKIIKKFNNYFKDNTRDEDENMNMDDYYRYIESGIQYI